MIFSNVKQIFRGNESLYVQFNNGKIVNFSKTVDTQNFKGEIPFFDVKYILEIGSRSEILFNDNRLFIYDIKYSDDSSKNIRFTILNNIKYVINSLLYLTTDNKVIKVEYNDFNKSTTYDFSVFDNIQKIISINNNNTFVLCNNKIYNCCYANNKVTNKGEIILGNNVCNMYEYIGDIYVNLSNNTISRIEIDTFNNSIQVVNDVFKKTDNKIINTYQCFMITDNNVYYRADSLNAAALFDSDSSNSEYQSITRHDYLSCIKDDIIDIQNIDLGNKNGSDVIILLKDGKLISYTNKINHLFNLADEEQYQGCDFSYNILPYSFEEYVLPPIKNDICSCGFEHSLLIKDDNLYTCGNNEYGQLGLGDNTNRKVFINTNISNIKEVSCGKYHSIYISINGDLYTCGNNQYGQLGLGDTTNRKVFTKVSNLPDKVKTVSCGDYHTMITLENDDTYACGLNSDGQLCLNDTNNRNTFTKINI